MNNWIEKKSRAILIAEAHGLFVSDDGAGD